MMICDDKTFLNEALLNTKTYEPLVYHPVLLRSHGKDPDNSLPKYTEKRRKGEPPEFVTRILNISLRWVRICQNIAPLCRKRISIEGKLAEFLTIAAASENNPANYLILFSPAQKEAIFVDTEKQPLTWVGLLENETNQASDNQDAIMKMTVCNKLPGAKAHLLGIDLLTASNPVILTFRSNRTMQEFYTQVVWYTSSHLVSSVPVSSKLGT